MNRAFLLQTLRGARADYPTPERRMSDQPRAVHAHPRGTYPDSRTIAMAQCEVCGNEYDKAFTVTVAGSEHVFDSFECAIHALAPRCAHCGCSVIGHGVEVKGEVYCCANCARESGETTVQDRAA
jgi:hypothetical protein